MHPARRTLAQQRSDAGPLALLLASWVLAVAPVAHPLLAHGVPFLRDGADERWVHHGGGPIGSSRPTLPPDHHHAPGSPEHLQLPLLAAAPPVSFETVMVAARLPPPLLRRTALPRRWSQEQPQGP
jgi:hypothetical protein